MVRILLRSFIFGYCFQMDVLLSIVIQLPVLLLALLTIEIYYGVGTPYSVKMMFIGGSNCTRLVCICFLFFAYELTLF
jgi:hypothetical protein